MAQRSVRERNMKSLKTIRVSSRSECCLMNTLKKMCGFNSCLYEREPQVVLVPFVRDRIHDLLFILLLELVYQTWLQFLSVSKQFINSCAQILTFVLPCN